MLQPNNIYLGDCLDVMKEIEDKSIDLIIIDPPYFRVKNCDWDNQWNNEQSFLSWLNIVLIQLYRILSNSGSIYCFCYPKMAFGVEQIVRNHFRVLNHIVWEKFNDKGFDGWKQKCSIDSLRKFYPNSERIIFAEKQSFGQFFRKKRLENNISTIKLAERIGAYGNVNHGGSVSNWENDLNIPTDEQYEKLLSIFDLPPRDSIIRVFNCKRSIQYTDVLKFKTVKPYKNKHPCEKPTKLLEHLIGVSTKKNSLVLDCFAGSGSTGVAAKNLNRNYILIEKEEKYFNIAKERLGMS